MATPLPAARGLKAAMMFGGTKEAIWQILVTSVTILCLFKGGNYNITKWLLKAGFAHLKEKEKITSRSLQETSLACATSICHCPLYQLCRSQRICKEL